MSFSNEIYEERCCDLVLYIPDKRAFVVAQLKHKSWTRSGTSSCVPEQVILPADVLAHLLTKKKKKNYKNYEKQNKQY